MDNTEARELLSSHLARYRKRSYADLVELQRRPVGTVGAIAPSGARYSIEVEAFWENAPGGNLRVAGSIDDGGWRAFSPMCDDFIIAPDGSFVGESARG